MSVGAYWCLRVPTDVCEWLLVYLMVPTGVSGCLLVSERTYGCLLVPTGVCGCLSMPSVV